MRLSLHAMAALAVTGLLLGACGREAGNQTNAAMGKETQTNLAQLAANEPASAPASNETASALPANFPSRDRDANGADCYVYLSMTMQAPGNAAGFDAVAMGQARDQWRSDLRLRLSETETQQLTGSNVNPLADTPAMQRDAAAHWCVEHSPVVDPA
jgi:hypothetical protein